MVHTWILIILGFLALGNITTSAAIFQAKEMGASWWLINSLAVMSFFLNIVIPFFITKLFLNKSSRLLTGRRSLNFWGEFND